LGCDSRSSTSGLITVDAIHTPRGGAAATKIRDFNRRLQAGPKTSQKARQIIVFSEIMPSVT
jgi:hypothetical protein